MEAVCLSGRTLPLWLLLVGLALSASPMTAAAEPRAAGGSLQDDVDQPASAQPAPIQIVQQLDGNAPVKPLRPIVVPPGMFAILAAELEKDIAETDLELPSTDARVQIPRPTTPNSRLVSRTDTVVGVAPTPLPDTGPGCPKPPPCKCK